MATIETRPLEQVVIRGKAPGAPRWKAALQAGLIAWSVALIFQILAAGGYTLPIRWMAGLSYDRGAFPPQGVLPTMVAAAIVYTAALSVEYASVLSTYLEPRLRKASAFWSGSAFGAGLYFFNLYALTAFLPQAAAARGWPTFWSHVVFGAIAAIAYFGARTGTRRPGARSHGEAALMR